MKKSKKIFISYAWEDQAHQDWVYNLAVRLSKDGFKTILDQYDLYPGNDTYQFMEQSIEHADYVLIILTKSYREKAETRRAGVGYETTLMAPDLLKRYDLATSKYIPIIRQGPREVCTPRSLLSKLAINLSAEIFDEKAYQLLVKGLKNMPARPAPNPRDPKDNDPLKNMELPKPSPWSDKQANLLHANDLSLILNITESLHPHYEKLNTLSSIFLKWYKRNPQIFKLAFKSDQNEIIGYSCIIPLSEDAFNRYRQGVLSEWEIGDNDHDIEPFSLESKYRYILIQSIEFKKRYWKKDGYGTAFISSFLRHMAYFNTDPVKTKMILTADGNTKGEDLLEHYGFHKILYHGDAKDPRPRFMLDFSDENLSPLARKTVTKISTHLMSSAR